MHMNFKKGQSYLLLLGSFLHWCPLCKVLSQEHNLHLPKVAGPYNNSAPQG